MGKISQLGDTILHKAGYIIREAVEDGMRCEQKKYLLSAVKGIKSQALSFEIEFHQQDIHLEIVSYI
jgi:thymidylate synthase